MFYNLIELLKLHELINNNKIYIHHQFLLYMDKCITHRQLLDEHNKRNNLIQKWNIIYKYYL